MKNVLEPVSVEPVLAVKRKRCDFARRVQVTVNPKVVKKVCIADIRLVDDTKDDMNCLVDLFASLVIGSKNDDIDRLTTLFGTLKIGD